MSYQSVLYLVYHIFLTPQLPQGDDFSAENENALLQCLQNALTKYCDLVSNDMKKIAEVAAGMANAMFCVHRPLGDTIGVDEGKLLNMLHELSKTGMLLYLVS